MKNKLLGCGRTPLSLLYHSYGLLYQEGFHLSDLPFSDLPSFHYYHPSSSNFSTPTHTATDRKLTPADRLQQPCPLSNQYW